MAAAEATQDDPSQERVKDAVPQAEESSEGQKQPIRKRIYANKHEQSTRGYSTQILDIDRYRQLETALLLDLLHLLLNIPQHRVLVFQPRRLVIVVVIL